MTSSVLSRPIIAVEDIMFEQQVFINGNVGNRQFVGNCDNNAGASVFILCLLLPLVCGCIVHRICVNRFACMKAPRKGYRKQNFGE